MVHHPLRSRSRLCLHCAVQLRLLDTSEHLSRALPRAVRDWYAPPYHRTIVIVHAILFALHAVCILLMLGGSVWQRSFAFSPWSCDTSPRNTRLNSDRSNSIVMQSFTKVYTKISDRHGFFGVNGAHFHVLLILREVVETGLQTIQAYRTSSLLPRTMLNRFYVVLLVANCWSSVLVYSVFFKGDEASRRFACIVLDCVLDLISCVGVELMIVLSYASDYNVSVMGFWDFMWQNDEWAARALNEFRMVFVVSLSDLASRAIFSLGLILTTTNMKELLQCLPQQRCHKIASLDTENDQTRGEKSTTIVPTLPQQPNLKPSELVMPI